MCLLKVKEEVDYTVPARYKRVTRVRRYSPSPPPIRRVSRYVEERRAPTYAEPPPSAAPAPLPPPEPPIIELPPPPPSTKAPTHVSRAPTVVPTVKAPTVVPSKAPSVAPSVAPSKAPSVRSRQSHYVEVAEDSSSSSSSSEDVRSKATSRSRATSKRTSRATTAVPPAPSVPGSIYSEHEREIRRERAYSRPRDQYETYRYVEPPRSSAVSDPRASRDSYGRRGEKISIHIDEHNGGRRR